MDRTITATDQGTLVEVARAAWALAQKHFELEPGLTRIFRIDVSGAGKGGFGIPIKLLEVNENTPDVGIMPLQFGPAPASGVPFPSVIIEISPTEFEKLRSNELSLPDGWMIGQEFPRPSDIPST